jgi:hypothetical protein
MNNLQYHMLVQHPADVARLKHSVMQLSELADLTVEHLYAAFSYAEWEEQWMPLDKETVIEFRQWLDASPSSGF